MKKSCKLLTVFLLAVTLGVFGNLNTVKAKSKIKISNSKITLTVRQSKTLKVKGTKKKPKWSSSKKSVATVSKKGKVVAKKAGRATITAKIGKKKYKCKVTVKNKKKTQNITKPTTTVPANPLGSRTNPYNPRNGVTINNYGSVYYFKLNEVRKGNDAINLLKSFGKWGEFEQEELSNNPNTNLVLFTFDVSAISGYDKYFLDGSDILNPYCFYNSSATQNLGGVSALYIDWEYDRSEIKLYNGGSSKMYAAFLIPNNVASFTYNNNGYWTKYDF